MLNSAEYLQLYEEAWVNDGRTGTPSFSGIVGTPQTWEEAKQTNTDWVDETIGTGLKQFYDFSVQKGAEKYNYYVGLSYDINESYLLGNSYERVSGRFNGDYRFSNKLQLSISTSVSRGDNNRVDAAWSGGLGAAMSTALPIYPIRYDEDVFDENGELVHSAGDYWLEAGIGNNPVAFRDLKDWRVREWRSINSMNLTYSPTNNLNFVLTGSYDYMNQIEDFWLGKELHGFDTINGGAALRTPRRIHNYNTFATGSYDMKLNEDSKLKFLVGAEYQMSYNMLSGIKTQTSDGRTDVINYVLDVDVPFYELENSEVVDFDTTWLEQDKRFNFLSYFTRVNYSYKDKYFLQGVLRADGSSKFGPNKRFGFFPSVSAGLILTEEKFLKYNPVFNFLKLKTSYGYVGSAGLEPNRWRGLVGTSNVGYAGNPIRFTTIRENPDLQWESSSVFDLGLEFGVFQDRITGELAYYNKRSRDVFLQISPPRSDGFPSFWDNVGEILNEGVEFSINSRNLVGAFQWSTNFNIAYNYNELTSIGGYSEDAVSGGTNDTRTVIGQPVGTNFLVRFSHVDTETGAPVYLDINGEETLTWDPNDRVPVGKVLPDAVGGITNNFRYKNFDLSFLVVYSIGGNIYDSSSKRQLGRVDDWNKTTLIFDRWQQPGDEATYPKLTLDEANLGSTTPWINTDLWLHDASYARLRNLTIGYTLPSAWLKRMKVSNMRVSFTGSNLLTFTNYPGVDPEIARDFENPTDRNMSPNISYLTPPQEKTYTFSLNLSF
jgi:TonB-linked SusC/RagA family outer membrane protein